MIEWEEDFWTRRRAYGAAYFPHLLYDVSVWAFWWVLIALINGLPPGTHSRAGFITVMGMIGIAVRLLFECRTREIRLDETGFSIRHIKEYRCSIYAISNLDYSAIGDDLVRLEFDAVRRSGRHRRFVIEVPRDIAARVKAVLDITANLFPEQREERLSAIYAAAGYPRPIYDWFLRGLGWALMIGAIGIGTEALEATDSKKRTVGVSIAFFFSALGAVLVDYKKVAKWLRRRFERKKQQNIQD